MHKILLADININDIADSLRKNGNFDLPETGTKITSPSSFYYNLLLFFTLAAGIIAVLVIIYSGIQYITAAGDAEKAERAKKAIMGAIIGIIVIITSYSVFNTTINILSNPSSDIEGIQRQMDQPPNMPNTP